MWEAVWATGKVGMEMRPHREWDAGWNIHNCMTISHTPDITRNMERGTGDEAGRGCGKKKKSIIIHTLMDTYAIGGKTAF